MKILGIDYGSKRVGLAISDETQTLARELSILSPKDFWQKIDEIVTTEVVERIVVGLPLNMSGGSTQSTEAVQKFSDELQIRFPSMPIEYMDERLSSVMAESMGRKKDVDSLAAQIILQNYLDRAKN